MNTKQLLQHSEFHLKMELLTMRFRIRLKQYASKLREYFSGLIAG